MKTEAKLIVTLAPLMVTLTGSGSETAGESYTLTCTASGGGQDIPVYQWHKGEMPLDMSDTLSFSQESNILNFSPLRQVDTGQYACIVTRGTIDATSDAFGITVQGIAI